MRLARTLLALLALPAIAGAQDYGATLSWPRPTQNVDGSALTDLAGYRVYWGTTFGVYPNSRTLSGADTLESRIDGLTPGAWHFAVTAINTASRESPYSTNLCSVVGGTGVCPLYPPGPVRNLVVTPAGATPPPAISVTVRYCGSPIDWCQFTATGAGQVTLTASNGVIDQTDFAVTPNVGGNNDGVSSRSITVTSPITGWFETDNVTGFASITVSGVTVPMTFANNAWTARTP